MIKSKILFFLLLIFSFNHVAADENLRHKIGQMIMVGFWGTEIPDSLKYDIEYRNLGGIVTLANNLESPSQIKALTDSLQSFAETELFISVDQEGGIVARLDEQNGYQATTSAYQLGTVFNSETTTRNQAKKMAGWLRAAGLNLNLAPVVDVNVNPNSPAIGYYGRSFSSDPMTVYQHASWFIDEFQKRDLITSLKHFPGHGSAKDDSHLGFTDVTHTWSSDELIPYGQFINAGYSDMIMSGHLFNAKIDSLHPATLSKLTINGLLRDSLAYQGVVVSDAMYMRAIQDNYEFDEAIELAINAGVDILLYTTHMRDGQSLVGTIIDLVEEKVETGHISESTINTAYERIIALKDRVLVSVDEPYGTVQTPKAHNIFAYPNPFNGMTRVLIDMNESGQARLELYNLRGQLINVILEEYLPAGLHEIHLDGAGLTSGVYLLKLEVNGISRTLKLSLLK